MNLANWTACSLTTFSFGFLRALIAALGGAISGLVEALVYNIVVGLMARSGFDLS